MRHRSGRSRFAIRAAAWMLCACPFLYFVGLTVGLSMGYSGIVWPFSSEGLEVLRSYMTFLLLLSLLPIAATCVLLAIILAIGVWHSRRPAQRRPVLLANVLSCILMMPVLFLIISTFQGDLVTGGSTTISIRNLDGWRASLFRNDTVSVVLTLLLTALLCRLCIFTRRQRPRFRHPLVWTTGIAWIASAILGIREASGINPVSSLFVRPDSLVISMGYTAALTTLTLGALAIAPALQSSCKDICGYCGYDLTGITSRCPECGTALTPQTS